MPLERLLRLWTSVLRRFLHPIRLLVHLKGLLWPISQLRCIIRRALTCRDSTAGSRQISYPDCATLPPETGYSMGILPISSPSGTLTQSSDSSLNDPDPFQSQPTTSGAPTPTTETSVSNRGSMEASRPRPGLCEEVKNLLAVSPTEFERYDRNETVYVTWWTFSILLLSTSNFAGKKKPSLYSLFPHLRNLSHRKFDKVVSEIAPDRLELKASFTPQLESIYASRRSTVLLSPGKQTTNAPYSTEDA
jgi:hypothetical protein